MEYLYEDEEEDENKEKLPFWFYVKTVLLLLLVLVVGTFLWLFIFPTPVGEGVITDKKYTAAYDKDITSEYTSETDKYEIYRHYPNVWQISVYGDDWFGRKRTEVFYVSRNRYNTLEIGDFLKLEGGWYYSEPPRYWDDPIPDELSKKGTGYHVIPHVMPFF